MAINDNIREVLLELASIANESPATNTDAVINHLKTDRLARFFLSKAICKEWNEILTEAHEIDLLNDNLQQAYISYLLRVFDDDPEQLHLSISEKLCELSRYNLFRLLSYANEQEPKEAARFIAIADKLTEAPDDIYGSTICEFITKVAAIEDTWTHVKELLSSILRFNLSQSKGYRDYAPKLDTHSFEELMVNGLTEIAEIRRLEIFELTLTTLNELIKLKVEPGNNSLPSVDEVHCQRVESASSGYADPEELLVIGITTLGLNIIEEIPVCAPDVIQLLDDSNWNITKRIRSLLYSRNPQLFADAVRAWIPCNLSRISQDDLTREEKFMLCCASAELKDTLVSKEVFQELLEAIKSGPDTTEYLEYLRKHFPAEDHAKLVLNSKKKHRQRALSLFKDSLPEEASQYLETLTNDLGETKTVWEEDREQAEQAQVHTVETKSPITEENLSALPDVDLIDYLNAWNQGGRNEDRFYVDVTSRALASTLQNAIEANPERFEPTKFDWKRIDNPEYHGAAINALKELHKRSEPVNLNQWLPLLEWMLDKEYQQFSQSGAHVTAEEVKQDTDPESHSAILNFVKTLIDPESKTPPELRPNISILIEKLCTTRQSSLESYVLKADDPTRVHSTAINTTRSKALETLIRFGIWIHKSTAEDAKQLPIEDCSKELRAVLEKRISAGPAMTPPELSVLAVDLHNLSYLTREWLRTWMPNIFTNDDVVWSKVFASHILYSKCLGWLYEDTKPNYARACENLDLFRYKERNNEQVVAHMGSHIFLLYLWNKFELPIQATSDGNLLSLFYANANDEEKCRTFSKITHMLGTDSDLEPEVVERSVAFIEYRISEAHPDELDGFDHLLRSKNFDQVWLLEKYAQLLDYKPTDGNFRSYELDHFFGAIDEEPLAAAKCFEKLTQRASTQDRFYLHSQDGKKFLKLLLEHKDEEVVKLGEQAQANLLNAEMFEYLEV